MEDDEQRILNDPEYAQAWVEQEIARGTFYFYKELGVEGRYVCDCVKNYGKACKHPDKYLEGGCSGYVLANMGRWRIGGWRYDRTLLNPVFSTGCYDISNQRKQAFEISHSRRKARASL